MINKSNSNKLLLSLLAPLTTCLLTVPQIASAEIFNRSVELKPDNYFMASLLAQGNCVARDNLQEEADKFISRCRRAGIRSEFPGEMLDETLGTINKGSSAIHKKAWKLLNDRRWLK